MQGMYLYVYLDTYRCTSLGKSPVVEFSNSYGQLRVARASALETIPGHSNQAR